MAAASSSSARCASSSRSLTNLLDNHQERMPSLPKSLRARLNITKDSLNGTSNKHNTFILYLPTIVLRKHQNPAFALAVRLANHLQLPLMVLGVVLDDAHHHHNVHNQQQPGSSNASAPEVTVVQTARRLTFTLQAYQRAAREWSEMGATVLVRVHAPGTRTPHHLTLAQQATVVVTDEPFVYPYRGLVESVERTCRNSGGAIVRVDGSTTVPPVSVLQRNATDNETITYRGVPDKAWKWQKQTDGKRKWHVLAAVRDGELDAPAIQVRASSNTVSHDNHAMARFLPQDWLDPSTPAPGKRPWTVDELQNLDIEDWVLHHCPGVDTSVPTCPQTHGAHGEERWKQFQQNALSQYAKRRNDIRQPHAVSRMSCYLNLGTVSILQIVYDLWYNHKNTSKFQDEVIKWREIGYAHCFATPQYFAPAAVPAWARNYWNRRWRQLQQPSRQPSNNNPYTLQQLANGTTHDATWNAMQRYLVETGELHNNARMTWGKTVVEWAFDGGLSLEQVLLQLATLNDRSALDGLSPPSYAGLLWCLGWGDKPARVISRKPASQYRVGPEGFALAQQRLLGGSGGNEEAIGAATASDRRASKHTNTAIHGGQLTITKAFQRQRDQQESQHQSPTKKFKEVKDEKNSTRALQTAVSSSSAPSSGRKPKKNHSITDYFPSSSSTARGDGARVVG